MLDSEWISDFISVKVVLPGCALYLYCSVDYYSAFNEMENTGIIDEKDSRLYDLNESSLNSTGNKISRTFIYGKSLTAPILGSFVPVPDVPKKYVEPTVLDTSLSHVSTSLLAIYGYTLRRDYSIHKFDGNARIQISLIVRSPYCFTIM